MDHHLDSFTAVLLPAEEGGYTVEFPQLPGCVTEGDTFEEALANAKEALDLWLAAVRERGEERPFNAEPIVARVRAG